MPGPDSSDRSIIYVTCVIVWAESTDSRQFSVLVLNRARTAISDLKYRARTAISDLKYRATELYLRPSGPIYTVLELYLRPSGLYTGY